jgi:hypothetical protein
VLEAAQLCGEQFVVAGRGVVCNSGLPGGEEAGPGEQLA